MPFRRIARGKSGFRRGTRRKNDWQRFYAADCGVSAAGGQQTTGIAWWVRPPADTVAASAAGQDVVPEDLTLVKTIAYFQGYHRKNLAANECYIDYHAWGFIVWEGIDDTNPSYVDVPSPFIDGDADWILHQVQPLVGDAITSAEFVIRYPSVLTDSLLMSRAMRKLSSKQGILFVTDYTNNSTSAAEYGYAAYARMLFKLP